MYKYIPTQELLDQDLLTYQEILNIKKRMTGYAKSNDKTTKDAEFKDEYKITQEHTDKGIEYLERVAFKPSLLGALHDAWRQRVGTVNVDEFTRKNCPLGEREIYILLDFDHFTFTGYYDGTSYGQGVMGFKSLLPLWKCYDKEGDSFEYYIGNGEMNIIG